MLVKTLSLGCIALLGAAFTLAGFSSTASANLAVHAGHVKQPAVAAMVTLVVVGRVIAIDAILVPSTAMEQLRLRSLFQKTVRRPLAAQP